MTSADYKQLLDLLHQLRNETITDGKQTTLMPLDIYHTLSEILPQIAIEAVIARRVPDTTPTGHIEVYLTQRPADAPTHQNMWHTPGSFLRRGETIADVMTRISTDDLKTATITSWHFIDIQNNHLEPHRHHLCPIFLVNITGDLTTGQWFPLDNLPEPICAHHRDGLLHKAIQPLLTEPYLQDHPEHNLT